MDRIEAAIAERAREQLSLITYDQLDAIGCTRQMRRSRVANGMLVPAGRRVLRVAAVACTWEQMALAALLDAGPYCLLSHMTAARLWRLHGVQPGAIELSIASPRHPRPVRGRIYRVGDLDPLDARNRPPFVLTSPERTIVDIADRCTADQLEDIVDAAARDGLLTLDSLGTCLDRLRRPGRAGIRALEAVLDRPSLQQRTDSWLERRLLRLLQAAGLPLPRTQVVLDKVGGGVARVDGFYDDVSLVLEADGHKTHSTRRQRRDDAEREAALVAMGWRVIRFTYEDVTKRQRYVADTVALHRRQLACACPELVAGQPVRDTQ